jgi:bacterioferritin-associated ferredoxin
MLVCHCAKICDRTIRACLDRGARSIDDVGRECGAGTVCGGCRPTIGALVAGELPDAGVISMGRARVRESAPERDAERDSESLPAVARAS